MIVDVHILVDVVFVAEAAGNHADTREAEALVERSGPFVAGNHGVELQAAEAACGRLAQAVLHEQAPNALAAAMVRRLHELDVQLPEALPQWLAEYAGVCVTLGQDVQILRAGETRLAHAIGIDEAGGLIVRYPDGTEGVVSSGEVSVRGMYGYV